MMKKSAILTLVILFILGCNTGNSSQKEAKGEMVETKISSATATFAGGCFWCVESDFEKVPGVLKVVSGYSGGDGVNPTYETYGAKGHIEAVQVFYDPAKVTYAQLLDVLWRHIDPTDAGGAVCRQGGRVPERHFLSQRRAAETRGKIQGGTGEIRSVYQTDRDRDPQV